MALQTTVRLIPTYNMTDEQRAFLEPLVASQVIVQGCLTCTYSEWDDAMNVRCTQFNSVPPHWAVAIGCQNYDYLPF